MGSTASKMLSPGNAQPAKGMDKNTNEHCSCCFCQFGKSNARSALPLRPLPEPPTAPLFRFLDLPAEIRCMVYEKLLVVGKVYFGCGPWEVRNYEVRNSGRFISRELYREPNLKLLRVCKLVHDEAEPIYLSKNLFVLPLGWHLMAPFASPPPWISNRIVSEQRTLFSKAALYHLQNLSISIDAKDTWDCASTAWTWDYEHAYKFGSLNARERQAEAHSHAYHKLTSTSHGWGRVTQVLKNLGCYSSGLRYIEIDFKNAFCPLGCCRPVGLVKFDWVRALKPKAMSILGLHGAAEESFLMHYIETFDNLSSNELRTRHALEFKKDCTCSTWGRWEFDISGSLSLQPSD